MRRITLLFVGMSSLIFCGSAKKKLHLQILRLRSWKSLSTIPGLIWLRSMGSFYLYPLDRSFDADGKDLNATPNVLESFHRSTFPAFQP